MNTSRITSILLLPTVVIYLATMAAFSLENDGIRNQCKDFSDDPFENSNVIPPSSTQYLENVSDISDDDFQFPSSQKRLPSR